MATLNMIGDTHLHGREGPQFLLLRAAGRVVHDIQDPNGNTLHSAPPPPPPGGGVPWTISLPRPSSTVHVHVVRKVCPPPPPPRFSRITPSALQGSLCRVLT